MSRKSCSYEMFLRAQSELEEAHLDQTYTALMHKIAINEDIKVSASTIRSFKIQQSELTKFENTHMSAIIAGSARGILTKALDDTAAAVAASLATIQQSFDNELLTCRETYAKELSDTTEAIRTESVRQTDRLNMELEGTIRELDTVIEHNRILAEEAGRLRQELASAHQRLAGLELTNMHLLAKLGILPSDSDAESIDDNSISASTGPQTEEAAPVYQTMVVEPDRSNDPFPPATDEGTDD